MIMLQGYVDDSGSDQSSKTFVLAGFLMGTEGWAQFSDDWDSQLKEKPHIDYFKMSEAASRKGQFLGWRQEFVFSKIQQLLPVIEKYNPTGIGSYVRRSEFSQHMKPYVSGPLLNPYQFLFAGVFESIVIHQKKAGIFPESVDVDFDEQGSAGQFALKMYPDFKAQCFEEERKVLGRIPLMLDDKKILPLQAADMLAWIIRRKLDGDVEWKWLFERLEPFLAIAVGFTVESFKGLLQDRKERLGY
jgi:hypothetical protein